MVSIGGAGRGSYGICGHTCIGGGNGGEGGTDRFVKIFCTDTHLCADVSLFSLHSTHILTFRTVCGQIIFPIMYNIMGLSAYLWCTLYNNIRITGIA